MEGSRRFPPPRRADKIAGGYVVRDANGQALAYLARVSARTIKQLAASAAEAVHRFCITLLNAPGGGGPRLATAELNDENVVWVEITDLGREMLAR
jgi:hypothetical protein